MEGYGLDSSDSGYEPLQALVNKVMILSSIKVSELRQALLHGVKQSSNNLFLGQKIALPKAL
jgi:hypothetical protein